MNMIFLQAELITKAGEKLLNYGLAGVMFVILLLTVYFVVKKMLLAQIGVLQASITAKDKTIALKDDKIEELNLQIQNLAAKYAEESKLHEKDNLKSIIDLTNNLKDVGLGVNNVLMLISELKAKLQ